MIDYLTLHPWLVPAFLAVFGVACYWLGCRHGWKAKTRSLWFNPDLPDWRWERSKPTVTIPPRHKPKEIARADETR